MSFLLKYNLATQITDTEAIDVKITIPKSIALTTDNKYTYSSINVTKGTPFTFTIDPLYYIRYLTVYSDESFLLQLNNSSSFITNSYSCDFGVNRIGFTDNTLITSLTISNPTGTSGPSGSQFTNPNIIDIKYFIVLEKI